MVALARPELFESHPEWGERTEKSLRLVAEAARLEVLELVVAVEEWRAVRTAGAPAAAPAQAAASAPAEDDDDIPF